MAIIDMRICDHVHQLPRLQSAYLRQHMYQHGVLHNVPVIGRQDVLGSLIQNSVEPVTRHVKSHAVGARLQTHLHKVVEFIDIGHDPA